MNRSQRELVEQLVARLEGRDPPVAGADDVEIVVTEAAAGRRGASAGPTSSPARVTAVDDDEHVPAM